MFEPGTDAGRHLDARLLQDEGGGLPHVRQDRAAAGAKDDV